MKGPSAFVYKVRAYDCPAGEWQIIDHHGAAYVVEEKLPVYYGRAAMYANPTYDAALFWYGLQPVSVNSWAMFYWNMHWRTSLGEVPQERITIIDYDYLTNEAPTARRKG